MDANFRNFKIIEFDTSQGNSFFNLIDSNRERLSEYFAGTVANTRTFDDTFNYCKLIDKKVKNKSYY